MKWWSGKRLSDRLEEFGEYCSLHGIKYLGNRILKWYDRLFWFAVLVTSFTISLYLLKGEVDSFSETPVAISLAKRSVSILNIPHPAVSICADISFHRPSILEGIRNLNFTELLDLLDFMESYLQVIDEQKLHRLHQLHYTENNLTKFDVVPVSLKEETHFRNYLYDFFIESDKIFLHDSLSSIDNFRASRLFRESWSEDEYLYYIEKFVDLHNKIASVSTTCFDKYRGHCIQRGISKDNKNMKNQCACFFSQNTLMEGHQCITINMIDATEIFSNNTKFIHYRTYIENDPEVEEYPDMNRNLWDIDKGYDWDVEVNPILPKETSFKTRVYPNRLTSYEGRIIMHRQYDDWIRSVTDDEYSYKIALHSPADIPSELMDWYKMEYGKNNLLYIVPEVTQTKDELEQMTPEQRGCRYSHENNLKLFKYYTEMNCMMECMSHNYLKEKKCVPLFLPRLRGTKICLVRDLRAIFILPTCKCLPLCTEIKYKVEKVIKDSQFFDSQLTFSYKFGINYTPNFRSLQYTWKDYIISCITILDTFLGLSLITFVEVIFYSSLIVRRFFSKLFFSCNVQPSIGVDSGKETACDQPTERTTHSPFPTSEIEEPQQRKSPVYWADLEFLPESPCHVSDVSNLSQVSNEQVIISINNC